MRKLIELVDPLSCISRASLHEMVFVLRGTDKAAPDVIRYWCSERVGLGLNKDSDEQLAEARECARVMEQDFQRPPTIIEISAIMRAMQLQYTSRKLRESLARG